MRSMAKRQGYLRFSFSLGVHFRLFQINVKGDQGAGAAPHIASDEADFQSENDCFYMASLAHPWSICMAIFSFIA